MRNHDDNRRPEEIEDDIERKRADVSSTIDAIQDKLTPGQLMDQAVAYLRTSGPADFGSNLGRTVRDNPVPVALIGVGIAWLVMSGQQRAGGPPRDAWRSSRHAGGWYEGDAGLDYDGSYGVDYAFADDESMAGEPGAMQRAREAGSDLKERAGEMGAQARERAQALGHRVSEGASSMGERARETVEEYRQRMRSAAGGARSRVSGMGQRSQQQYYRARDSVSHMVDEQPLVLGALGVAIGAALGAALPSTRQENEWMGRTRDDLLEGARETFREQAESVKGAAERVAKTAQDEASHLAHRAGSDRGPRNGSVERPSASSVPGDSPGTSSGSSQSGAGSSVSGGGPGTPGTSGTPGDRSPR
jgi:ElaB/YqjD/DUF883 family membrane-anchored ribosome-binding protein